MKVEGTFVEVVIIDSSTTPRRLSVQGKEGKGKQIHYHQSNPKIALALTNTSLCPALNPSARSSHLFNPKALNPS